MSGNACDFLRENPFRPADWRWHRATWLVANKKNSSRKRDDEETCRAVEFVRASLRIGGEISGNRLMRRFPDIVLAMKCHQGEPLVRLELECRILGREPVQLIAEHTQMTLTTIEAYKNYFFDIDDRIDASSFISHRILALPSHGLNSAELWMKRSVYAHGPAMIDPWMDFLRHRGQTHDLSTFVGWQRDLIDIQLRARELAGDDANTDGLSRMLAFIGDKFQKIAVFRSASTVFHEMAITESARIQWAETPARHEQRPLPHRRKLPGRYDAPHGFAKVG